MLQEYYSQHPQQKLARGSGQILSLLLVILSYLSDVLFHAQSNVDIFFVRQ